MEGWIKLHRKITENPYYLSEKFTRSQAWIDLLIIANHKQGMYYLRGIKIIVNRGQIGWGIERLAKRWQWSRGKVERFLIDLENEKQIVRQKTNAISLISLVNYEIYQEDNKANSKANIKADSKAKEHQTINQTDTNNNENNYNNINNENKKENLILPFTSNSFTDLWNTLLKEKKWKNKSTTALKLVLEKLGKFDESTAMQMMENTIAGEWQGIFEIKEKNKSNSSNGKSTTKTTDTIRNAHTILERRGIDANKFLSNTTAS